MQEPIKLIIVDDEKEIRLGLSNYFPWQKIGYDVVGVFESCAQALDFLSSNSCDVILTDIKMPGMTGIDLARIVHTDYPDIIVVFLSGYADFEYAKKAIEYGVRFYIVKPTVFDEIDQVFKKVSIEFHKAKETRNEVADEAQGYNEKIISRVVKYIEINLNTVSLDSAARYVNLNSHYLSVFFKKHTGQKFVDFVRETKMRKAKELLSDPSLRIYEISDMLGYGNSNNFSRIYSSYYGISPREYRKANIPDSVND